MGIGHHGTQWPHAAVVRLKATGIMPIRSARLTTRNATLHGPASLERPDRSSGSSTFSYALRTGQVVKLKDNPTWAHKEVRFERAVILSPHLIELPPYRCRQSDSARFSRSRRPIKAANSPSSRYPGQTV
jgi:hypothetical protein